MRIVKKLNRQFSIVKAILTHQKDSQSLYIPQGKKPHMSRNKRYKKFLYITITEGKTEDKNLPLRVTNTLKKFFGYQGVIFRVKDQWPHWRGLEIIKEEHNILVMLHVYKNMTKNFQSRKTKKSLRERFKYGVDYMLVN